MSFRDFVYSNNKNGSQWERQTKTKYLQRTRMGSLIEVANDYLSYVQKKFTSSTYSDKKRVLKKLIAAFGPEIPMIDITTKAMWNHMEKLGPATKFNRTRKELLAFFNYGVKFHELPANPVAKIDPLPVKRKPQAVLTEEEFVRLMLAAQRYDRNLLIVLGCRFYFVGKKRPEIGHILGSGLIISVI
jgi:integrase